MAIVDNLNKQNEPTTPSDAQDPPRFGQAIETTKDAFILELKKFFDRQYQTSSRAEEIPTIKKYDVSFAPGETSLETFVKLIQKHPNVAENLPLIAVLGSTGRNYPMGIGGPYVGSVLPRPAVLGTVTQPFVLIDQQTLIYKTTDRQKAEHTTTIVFRASRFINIAAATADEVAAEINFQSLYATASNNGAGKVSIGVGGPLLKNTAGDIEIVGGTAAAALGFTPGQKTLYTSVTPMNRYIHSTSLDIAIEVASEDENQRTELTDLVWDFFTFYLHERDYTFLGRSIFTPGISNETYQVTIKPDPTIAGEQEVPRPQDQVDKVYVNRITVPVVTMQYTDRAVVTGLSTPLYLDSSTVQVDETIPQKN